jgi:ribosomal protein S18 acetylase RimI-like enzyme
MSMTVTTTEVRKARTDDHPNVSRALTLAFFDDPVFEWIFSDVGRRRRAVPGFFDLFVAAFGPHDEIYTTDGAAGAALWLPPGAEMIAEDELAHFGQRLQEVAGTDASRLFEVSDMMESNHPHEAHYYLNFVGVAPVHQGLGLGSALMSPVLDRCDRDGVPAYLEATTSRSRALYERHGFEVMGELACPGGGPSMWPMWRLPR